MHDTNANRDAALIADLNDLLQLDHDAVEAYTIAIDLARDAQYRETLVEFRADHKRHIEELAALVRQRGGLPLELPHPTGPLKLTVQALGAIGGDTPLLLAFKAVEGQGRDKYRRFARNSYPDDVAEVVRRAAEDEERHYRWVERTLSERGVGAGTLPHGLAQAVEGIHKLIADPIERVERDVIRAVGQMVGTTRTRGGSAAPSPAKAAEGMADHANDTMRDSNPDTMRRGQANADSAGASTGRATSGGSSAMGDDVGESMREAADDMAGAVRDMTGDRSGRSTTGSTTGRERTVSDSMRAGHTGSADEGGTDEGSADTDRFIAALRALEDSNDVDGIASLFAPDAEISNPTDTTPHRGVDGARTFWRNYRATFDEIHSDFSRVVENGDTAMLEWTSRGRARGGDPVRYSGVSVLEMRDGKVRRFRTYFDTNELAHQVRGD